MFKKLKYCLLLVAGVFCLMAGLTACNHVDNFKVYFSCYINDTKYENLIKTDENNGLFTFSIGENITFTSNQNLLDPIPSGAVVEINLQNSDYEFAGYKLNDENMSDGTIQFTITSDVALCLYFIEPEYSLNFNLINVDEQLETTLVKNIDNSYSLIYDDATYMLIDGIPEKLTKGSEINLTLTINFITEITEIVINETSVSFEIEEGSEYNSIQISFILTQNTTISIHGLFFSM